MNSRLVDFHSEYKEKSLKNRRFKHEDIQPLIDSCGFETEIIGYSFECKVIKKIKVGSGPRKILLWSQMHGDEATATMAIFDILRFLGNEHPRFAEIRNTILTELELHFVPMLNPDGAERFQRRTAQGIDMNRDALSLQCPESRLLKKLVEEIKPEFSFNLHDQSNYYAAGNMPMQTAIAFLATAYNEATEWNEVRTKSMQVICKMNEELQTVIPHRVARFSDEFEPRAFGDNIQKWGSSLILLESGSYPGDPEKQYIRALNFQAILQGLNTIALNEYQNYSLKNYLDIPENNRNFFDLKITNLSVENPYGTYSIDLGVFITEKNNAPISDFVYESVIEDMGDLSVFNGITLLDAKGGVLKSLHDFPELLKQYEHLEVSKNVEIGESATFVIDHGNALTLILNGKII